MRGADAAPYAAIARGARNAVNSQVEGSVDGNNQSVWSLSIAAVMLLTISSSSVVAQEPHVEFSGGYSLLHVNSASMNFPKGWFGSAGGRVALGKFRKDWFGIVGEVSGNEKTVRPLGFDLHLTALSLMGGAKFVAHEWRQLTPFGQFLVGMTREGANSEPLHVDGSASHFAYQPGGGVDVGVSSRWAIRAEVSWRLIGTTGISNSYQQLMAGVVWRQ